MSRKRFDAEQIVAKLRQIEVLTAGGKTQAQACKEAGITEVTYYRWGKKYGGLKANQPKRVKDLERENQRFKKLVADQGDFEGSIIATAMLATEGDACPFRNGRQMSASIGLTPKQHGSGGKKRIRDFSKRSDAYLRSLLIHGARAVIRTARANDDPLSEWVTRIAVRRHPNVAATALAKKTTRIAWMMLSQEMNY